MSRRTARRAALDAVLAAVPSAAAGRGHAVVVSGPPGIGKTRLLSLARESGHEAGLTVVHGHASELDRVAPLSALLHALRRADPPLLSGPEVTDMAEFARDSANRLWLIHRIGERLEERSAERPVLVLFDDAQWVDEVTAYALRVLVPSMAHNPVSWLIACRPETNPGPGSATVDWLLRDGAESVRLAPLDATEIAQMCREELGVEPGPEVLSLAQRTGGNPLLLTELLDAMREAEGAELGDGIAGLVSGPLPNAFVEAVSHRLRNLSPTTRRLLDIAAVFGKPITVHDAAALGAGSPLELVDSVREGVELGILSGDSAQLCFRQQLVREVLYRHLPEVTRRMLHREAATRLNLQGRSVEAAEHLLSSALPGDRQAVEALLGVLTTVIATAPNAAADLLLRTLDLLGEHEPSRAKLTAHAVHALTAAGRVTEARRLGERAVATRMLGDFDAAVHLGLAEAAKHAGDDRGALDHIERALAAEPALPMRARLLALRAHACLYVDDFDGTQAAGKEAVTLGRSVVSAPARGGRSGDTRTEAAPDAAVFAGAALSVVAAAAGDLDRGLEEADVAVALADAEGGQARHRHPRLWLARVLLWSDRFAEAEAVLEVGQREAEALGTGWSMPLWHCYRAELRLAVGRLDDAVTEAEAGLRVAAELDALALTASLEAVLVQAALWRGRGSDARAALRRGLDQRERGIGMLAEDLTWEQALVAVDAGDDKTALRVLSDLLDRLPGRALLLVEEPTAAPRLVRLALAEGDTDLANRVVDAAAIVADRNPRVRSFTAAARHAEGLRDDARATLAEAADLFDDSGRPLAAAWALEDVAAVAARAGDRAGAVRALERAQTLTARCGADRETTRLHQTLRTLGEKGRSARATGAATGWAALTESELRVARLVAEGLTNRATARSLFLSPHTVDTHLRHIYAKLGVSSRVELVRLALRHEGGGNHEKT